MSETTTCRPRLAQFCQARNGLDIGFGGDPIVPWAITLDRPEGDPARANVGQVYTQLTHDALWLPFKDNTLDWVFSSHVLEDFADTGAALREWLRVIKPKGYLVLFLPDEATYRRHCTEHNNQRNMAHQHENFGLAYVKALLPPDCGIVYEAFPVPGNAYSFDLVLQKTA